MRTRRPRWGHECSGTAEEGNREHDGHGDGPLKDVQLPQSKPHDLEETNPTIY